jgi:hypothetical protein
MRGAPAPAPRVAPVRARSTLAALAMTIVLSLVTVAVGPAHSSHHVTGGGLHFLCVL